MKKILNLDMLQLAIENYGKTIYKNQTEKLSKVILLNARLVDLIGMIKNNELFVADNSVIPE